MQSLHIKYRPKNLDDVVGQDSVVKSIKSQVKNPSSQAFLFDGPSGCGKTTLARLLAEGLDCQDIQEVDAATNNSVEDMRDITSNLRYKAFSGSGNKAIILDEAHMLSKSAWNSLLKSIEEPPEHVYWFVLTTEVGKVPATIKTRCVHYKLPSVGIDDIFDLLDYVSYHESLELPEEVLEVVSKNSSGSPRQALVNLTTVADCSDRQEAAKLLRTALDSKGAIDLCQYLVSKKTYNWQELMKYIGALEGQNPESVRLTIVSYFTSVAVNSKKEDKAAKALDILEAFNEPCREQDKMAQIVIALGRLAL